MGARSKARKRAVDVLFEADQRAQPRLDVLTEQEGRGSGPLNPYVGTLVRAVDAHAQTIDDLLTANTTGWPLDRMPAVDRAILRLAVGELLWGEDVPDAVVIDEWVELAKQLSTDESPAFVNGVLGKVVQHNADGPPGDAEVPPVGFEPTNPAV